MKTKHNICVKLTEKNCKKILGILEVFGEKIDESTRISLEVSSPYWQNPCIEFWGGRWIGSVNDEDKTLIKPKQLRELLKELHKPDVESTITKEVWVVDCGFRVEATTEGETANAILELYGGKKVKGTLTYKI